MFVAPIGFWLTASFQSTEYRFVWSRKQLKHVETGRSLMVSTHPKKPWIFSGILWDATAELELVSIFAPWMHQWQPPAVKSKNSLGFVNWDLISSTFLFDLKKIWKKLPSNLEQFAFWEEKHPAPLSKPPRLGTPGPGTDVLRQSLDRSLRSHEEIVGEKQQKRACKLKGLGFILGLFFVCFFFFELKSVKLSLFNCLSWWKPPISKKGACGSPTAAKSKESLAVPVEIWTVNSWDLIHK